MVEHHPSADGPHAEQVSFAGVLTATGGFLDAFTYVGHGHVFANSMTGNVVLMGLAADAGDRIAVWWHLVPILAFIGGVAVAHAIRLGVRERSTRRVEQISLWLEIGFLGLVHRCLIDYRTRPSSSASPSWPRSRAPASRA